MDLAPNMSDYDRYYRSFRWQVPERFNFGSDVVDRWAADPARVALIWSSRDGSRARLTFADVSQASNRFANALLGLGVRRGDRLLLHLPRVPEWLVATVACIKAGIVVIPTPAMATPSDLASRLADSGATALVTTTAAAEAIDASDAGAAPLRARVAVRRPAADARLLPGGWHSFDALVQAASPDLTIADTAAGEPAVIYYTSGTTGTPKGIVHAHRALYAWREQAFCWLDSKLGDLHWCTADTGWSKFGTSMVFGPWSWGVTLLMYDGDFDVEQRFAMLEEQRVTTFCGAPTEFRLMVQEGPRGRTLDGLRHCVSAGEPMNPEVIERWRDATGVVIRDGYGLTEALMVCHNYRSLPLRPGSMGKPLPGYEMAVVDESGGAVAAGSEGNLALRTSNPCFMLGHWNGGGATLPAATNGWFLTGDRGWIDGDGYYWFVGRGDDVILSAGYRIGPFEVESALLGHEAVAESAAVGSPDPVRGEIVKSFVVLREGFRPGPELVAGLQAHVKETTAPYKYPREIEFVASLPKTISGKIRRRELRQREYERKGSQMGIAAPVERSSGA